MFRRLVIGTLSVMTFAACGPHASVGDNGTPRPQLSASQLKYRIIAAVGQVRYCDPDEYPIASLEGAQENALRLYPSIRASGDAYTVILHHLNLAEPLSDAQKLSVYTDWKELSALHLPGSKARFAFDQLFRVGAEVQEVAGSVSGDGRVSVDGRKPRRLNCPLCLVGSTSIDTPHGRVPVTAIRSGMLVWSADELGNRIAAAVLETGRTLAPVGHLVLRVTLADGHSVSASPGHPTADGRQLAELHVGDVFDGSVIDAIVPIPYVGFTYDLLPAGPTGAYWANGILVGSSLFRNRPPPPTPVPRGAQRND